jgi:hypothetical protein
MINTKSSAKSMPLGLSLPLYPLLSLSLLFPLHFTKGLTFFLVCSELFTEIFFELALSVNRSISAPLTKVLGPSTPGRLFFTMRTSSRRLTCGISWHVPQVSQGTEVWAYCNEYKSEDVLLAVLLLPTSHTPKFYTQDTTLQDSGRETTTSSSSPPQDPQNPTDSENLITEEPVTSFHALVGCPQKELRKMFFKFCERFRSESRSQANLISWNPLQILGRGREETKFKNFLELEQRVRIRHSAVLHLLTHAATTLQIPPPTPLLRCVPIEINLQGSFIQFARELYRLVNLSSVFSPFFLLPSSFFLLPSSFSSFFSSASPSLLLASPHYNYLMLSNRSIRGFDRFEPQPQLKDYLQKGEEDLTTVLFTAHSPASTSSSSSSFDFPLVNEDDISEDEFVRLCQRLACLNIENRISTEALMNRLHAPLPAPLALVLWSLVPAYSNERGIMFVPIIPEQKEELVAQGEDEEDDYIDETPEAESRRFERQEARKRERSSSGNVSRRASKESIEEYWPLRDNQGMEQLLEELGDYER